jgi:hypothetical protein
MYRQEASKTTACAKVEKFGGIPYPPEVTNFTLAYRWIGAAKALSLTNSRIAALCQCSFTNTTPHKAPHKLQLMIMPRMMSSGGNIIFDLSQPVLLATSY